MPNNRAWNAGSKIIINILTLLTEQMIELDKKNQ